MTWGIKPQLKWNQAIDSAWKKWNKVLVKKEEPPTKPVISKQELWKGWIR